MKLSVAALAIAGAILWAASVFFVGLANMAVPGYGTPFLNLIAALYPGYRVGAGIDSLLIGTAYAFAGGAIGGALFGWLYNVVVVASRERKTHVVAGQRSESKFQHHAH